MNAIPAPIRPECFSIEETAARLNVSAKLIRAMIKRGELRAIRLGRILRIPESEIQRLTGTAAP